MLDTFIERWLGPLLTVVGAAGVLAGVAGYCHLLPPPWSLAPEDAHIIGSSRLTSVAEMGILLGSLVGVWGVAIIAYFRRERRQSRDSV